MSLELPVIPGGWSERVIDLPGGPLRLTVPADPDALLEALSARAGTRDDDAPYWCCLWPAAEVMSRLILKLDWPPQTAALEIGCGLGLVGLAGCRAGFAMTLSDVCPEAVAVAGYNAGRNGFRPASTVIDWSMPPPRRFPVILGCDLLYEVRNHRPLLAFLQRGLEQTGEAWIGDPGRQHAEQFLRLAEGEFRVELRDARCEPTDGLRTGRFRLVRLTPRH